jgi:hypothetical protein
VLKGGGAMLARDRRARHTTDLDMLNRTHSLGEAVDALRAAVAKDAGDFLTFGVQKVVPIAEGEAAPVWGRRVFLDVRCGAAAFAKFHVDVVVEDTITGTVERIPAAALVTMPGIARPTVRLYPITDHVADKVLAAVSTYGPRQLPSSRVRDLVDGHPRPHHHAPWALSSPRRSPLSGSPGRWRPSPSSPRRRPGPAPTRSRRRPRSPRPPTARRSPKSGRSSTPCSPARHGDAGTLTKKVWVPPPG